MKSWPMPHINAIVKRMVAVTIKITQRITASAVWDIEGTEAHLQYRKEYPEPVMRKKIEDYRSALESRTYEQDNTGFCEEFTVFGGIAFVAIGLSCREEFLRCFSYYAMQFAREWADGEKHLKSDADTRRLPI